MQHSHVVELHRRLEDIVEDVDDLRVGQLDLLLLDVVDEMPQVPKLLVLRHDGKPVVDALHVVPEIDQLGVVSPWEVDRFSDVLMDSDFVAVLRSGKGYHATVLVHVGLNRRFGR